MVNELLEQIVTVCELKGDSTFFKCYELNECFYFEVFYDLNFVLDRKVEFIDFRTFDSHKVIRIHANEDIELVYC